MVLTSWGLFLFLAALPVGTPEYLSLSLDGRFLYSPQQAFTALSELGAEGRSEMVMIHWLDFLLITAYTAAFTLTLSWLLARTFPPAHPAQAGVFLPMLGGLFDVMENLFILRLLAGYPDQLLVSARLASIFTFLKFITGGGILLLLLIALAGAAQNHFRLCGEK